MQNREAAQYVTETFQSVTTTLFASLKQIDILEQEGKVSNAEADAYCHNVIEPLEQMLNSVLSPIFDIHPDLNFKCCYCSSAEESEF